MSTESFRDLAAFVQFAQGQLGVENVLSPEECLALYRGQQASEEDISAVKEALEAMHRGDVGIPIDEFDRQFRVKNGIPPRE
jgi:hypothetical protein